MKEFRVVEIFGPTIQGEGRRIGTPCYFIRFGGCDYRCSWCDSPFAVLPNLVAQAEKVEEMEIVRRVKALPPGPSWVVFSGGNPALFDLARLQHYLQTSGFGVMVETQGTVWHDWLLAADDVCVSPKPPSSGNRTPFSITYEFLNRLPALPRPYLKIPVFNDADYNYACDLHKYCPAWEMFLSVGNEDPSLPTVGNNAQPDTESTALTRDIVCDKLAWLMEKVAKDPLMSGVRVTPQMHVLGWGNERGR